MSDAYARKRTRVVERDRARAIDTKRAQQGRLCALAQLQREHVGAVEHARAEKLERPHVGERQRHRARVAANVGARAGLVEIEPGASRFDVAEGGARHIEWFERDAAALQRGK